MQPEQPKSREDLSYESSLRYREKDGGFKKRDDNQATTDDSSSDSTNQVGGVDRTERTPSVR
jgi:hypothetical protein